MGSKDAFAFSTAMTHAALMKFTPSCTSPIPGMVKNEIEKERWKNKIEGINKKRRDEVGRRKEERGGSEGRVVEKEGDEDNCQEQSNPVRQLEHKSKYGIVCITCCICYLVL